MKGRDFARRALEVAADDLAVLSNATQAAAYFGEMCSRSMSPTCEGTRRRHGRLTLSAVSDEETFGPWGARYLSEHHPEVFGDCCLNGEPSSPLTLRFGREGAVVARIHGAHPGRARRLHAPERERHRDCRADHRRPLSA